MPLANQLVVEVLLTCSKCHEVVIDIILPVAVVLVKYKPIGRNGLLDLDGMLTIASTLGKNFGTQLSFYLVAILAETLAKSGIGCHCCGQALSNDDVRADEARHGAKAKSRRRTIDLDKLLTGLYIDSSEVLSLLLLGVSRILGVSVNHLKLGLSIVENRLSLHRSPARKDG